MNDTMSPEGFVPLALVFREYPSVRAFRESYQEKMTLYNRSKLATEDRNAISKIMANLRVNRALQHSVPISADKTFSPGDQVLGWRKKQVNNLISEWKGPYSVELQDHEKRFVYIRETPEEKVLAFSLAQVKRYLPS
eukprot:IDg11912t1